MNAQEFIKPDHYYLSWQDPKTGTLSNAGVAFYNDNYDEYFLRIDEEPNDKKYYLKAVSLDGDKLVYRLELILKRTDGSFKKRVKVGSGFTDLSTEGNVIINYGSKYKDLVLHLGV